MPTYAENLIGSVTVGAGGQSTITFSSIPQTYTDLVLRISARGSNTNYWAALALNGSSSNFTLKNVQGNGSAAYSNSDTTNTYSFHQNPSSYTANTFASTEFYIPNYTSANYKSISNETVQENNGTEAYSECTAMLWSNTAAISSITLTSGGGGNFAQYTTAYLYGISNANPSGATGSVPKATGGVISYSNGYWIHTFNSTGTFTPNQSLTVDYLVVAGGGGGGGGDTTGGGGGGGGGVRSTVTATGGGGSLESAISVTAQAYTVTVGAGGSGGVYPPGAASNGSDSSFSTVTSTGGGRGGMNANGSSGGSGGGGGVGTSRTGGAGTSNQGYAGGTGGAGNGGYTVAGGGGGAGGAGGNGSTSGGGGGGGVNVSITGSSVGYAGGGGGGSSNINWANPGGGGGSGGGDSIANSAAGSGTANTGGGGGGESFNTSNGNRQNGGNGGSGIVIVRYPA